MLDLSTAVLCDFAQVRDRLLFVSSGAVSRLYRQELPSPLGLMVGLVIEVPLEDAGMEHQLRAEVINRHGTVLATLENTFRVSDVGLFPHEVQQVPLVLSITGVRARTWGTHQVRLYLDNELVRALTLYVVPAAGPQATVRATPTQSRVADDEGSLGATPGEPGADAPGDGPDDQPPPAPQPPAEEPDRGHEVLLERDELESLDAPIVLDEGFTAAPSSPAASPAPEAPAPAPPAPAPAFADPQPQPAPPAPAPAFADPQPQPQPAPQPQPTAPAAPPAGAYQAPPPGADEAVDWGSARPAPPSPQPAPQPAQAQPQPQPAPQPPRPSIDAPQAAPPAGQPTVFDFEDQDDLDRDPTPPERERDRESSRFSFRYLMDDE